jgi:hypothetical protein
MKKLMHRFGLIGTTLTSLLLVGCLLSGTFVVSMLFKDFPVAGSGNLYYFDVDVTSEDVWTDHEDNIKDIDNVGFELWVTNVSGVANTYECYIAPMASLLSGQSSKSTVVAGATKVLEVPLAATGQTFIGYADSFSHLTNLETLKALAESGQFKFWAMSAATLTDFTVDSILVVITFTAGT